MIKLAVIGDPIEHSLSPLVHGVVMECIKKPYQYQKVQVKKGELQDFLSYAKEEGIHGFNLTMPHKVDVLPLLDEMDEEAKLFQSVNTVKVSQGRLSGYNTDALGYELSMNIKGYSFANSRVVILGAGGVVRTLALKAAKSGAKEIFICNRTKEKAVEIAENVAQVTGTPVYSGAFNVEAITEFVKSCDIIMNGTPLGMHGVSGDYEDLSFLEAVPKTALVSDLIYNPSKTKFLAKAESLGLDTMNGLGMLIYQGILADEIYLGQTLNREELFQSIGRKICEKLGL